MKNLGANYNNIYEYVSFLAILMIIVCHSALFAGAATAVNKKTFRVKVGVVLDLETPVAKIWMSSINMAISEFYASHPHFNTRLSLQSRDSHKDVVSAASAALDLVKNEQVQAILGPQASSQAKFIIQLGQRSEVPFISFSATSPSLTSASYRSSYFFRAAINDTSQVHPITSLIAAFGWRQVVPIFSDNDYGNGIVPYLVDALQAVDARVPYRSVIPPSATDDEIEKELYKLMTMQTRVFVVHMCSDLGSRLFEKARDIGMMGQGFVWIVTNDFTDLLGSLSPSVIESMQGVLGVKTYVRRTKKLLSFRDRWKREFRRQNPEILDAELNTMGLWAYDSVFALALAVEKVFNESGNSKSFVFEKSKTSNSSINSTDLDSILVSRNGPRLSEALSSTRFTGVSGNFSFVNGQLQTSAFEVVNVIGGGERRIGFWIPEKGLTSPRRWVNNNTSSSTSPTWQQKLRPIIWPGESTVAPKGWEIPTKGNRLKIGVPVKGGFKEFVEVKVDQKSNTTKVTGFSIDVFEAAVRELRYALPYDYIPFAISPDGVSSGTYDDLVFQVYLGKYDAVVADATIRANRSLYVDFTLPYTESGVVMVVPLKDHKRSAWIFLEPLTWDLWVTSTCFFIFIGFVVWVLEHRINKDFRGPPSHQIGTSFWFSFSTMVFAHKERVVSNLARFVVIIWVFVVLILTQSYTASLTSLLTVEKLEPTISDLNTLLKSGDRVGYLVGSFVYGLLKETGFPDSRIVPFKSVEECDELLSKGSTNGGISAAIDETPNMKLFFAQYRSKYTTIGPIFKTAGFGFVFPKGSPLVADVSRAILNVTEGEEMKHIEKKWFNNLDEEWLDFQPKVTSNSLSLGSFWGLFLIAGTASVAALLVFAVTFIYKHRQVLSNSKQDSIWRRIQAISKRFDQKDLSSHTFKEDVSTINVDVINSVCPTSPSSYSVDITAPNSPSILGEPFSSGQASPTLVLWRNIELMDANNNETPRTTNTLAVNV